MPGRPPKPILLKSLEGDTRQRGANKHAESLSETMLSRRGVPEAPSFHVPSIPKDAPAEIQIAHAAAKRRSKVAREHWEYLCRELGREGLLSTVDQGALLAASQTFALAQEAFLAGTVGAHARLTKQYMQIADRCGLNESARAKFPKREPAMDDLESALCG